MKCDDCGAVPETQAEAGAWADVDADVELCAQCAPGYAHLTVVSL